MKVTSCVFFLSLIGLFSFLLGLGLAWFGTKNLIRMWAWEKLTLKNNSEAMTRWIRPPTPITLKLYIYNVTNAEAVSEGAYPILSEVGPYVYEQFREKVNIEQLENYTLSYQLQNIMQFKPKLSGRRKESDVVTVLNVPLAGAILSVNEAVPELVGMLDEIWNYFYPGQTNIFITTTVRNILFDGITMDCSSKITEVYLACRALESRKTSAVRKEGKNYKFSFFHAKNGTTPETYQINQGVIDITKSAQFVTINHSPSVKTWNNEYCDMINGSDGAQFPVLVSKHQRLYLFEKDLCRSVYAEFEEEVVMKGVVLYKFKNSRSLFASAEENPDNQCFCRRPMHIEELVEETIGGSSKGEKKRTGPQICFESGVLPLMPCVGSPIVASFPHFYLGDEIYMNYSGLYPDKKLHETYVYIEPISGMAVLGYKRIQFNLEVKRIPDVQISANLIDGLFPILWVEEKVELSDELFKLLRYSLIQKKILEYLTFILIGLGALLLIITHTASYLLEKTVCFARPNSEIHNFNTLAATEAHNYEQNVRARLGIWQNSKVSTISGNIMNQKIPGGLQKTILTDNFLN